MIEETVHDLRHADSINPVDDSVKAVLRQSVREQNTIPMNE